MAKAKVSRLPRTAMALAGPVGSLGPGGSVSYQGMLYYRTDSQKMARMNNMSVAFEFEVDAAGNTSSKMWEWKGSAAAVGKSA